MDHRLTTDRLTLRPLRPADAPAIRAHCDSWAVVSMLSQVPYPYPEGLAERWIDAHPVWRAEGSAYHFGIEATQLANAAAPLIGVITLEREQEASFRLGYWVAQAWWGRGVATEAVRRIIDYAFGDLAAETLFADHFDDNPASGRVLNKCGFRYAGPAEIWCEARSRNVWGRHLVLERPALAVEAAAP